MKNRRKLVVALCSGALAAPLASFGQLPARVWRVGFLHQSNRPESIEESFIGAFPEGMRELGYVVGKNLTIDWRFSDNIPGREMALATELAHEKVDVIITSGTSTAKAAQAATSIIPIVMASSGDPVAGGLVKSLARPGGNITGLTNIMADVIPRLLGILVDMVPRLSRVAVLLNQTSSTMPLKSLEAMARPAGITIVPISVQSPQELERAFARMVQLKAGALIVVRDPALNRQLRQIAELAARHRLPTIAGIREYAEAGGLMSYGSNLAQQFRRAATFVDKIFKGAKPGDLPIEQPTKFELFINGKTARSLGLKIPQSLLISADKVIE